nr:immunoglobulin light chain junction region [Macaca mulatta]
CLQGYSSPCSF